MPADREQIRSPPQASLMPRFAPGKRPVTEREPALSRYGPSAKMPALLSCRDLLPGAANAVNTVIAAMPDSILPEAPWTVYTPHDDSTLRGNPLVRMAKDCWAARELAWRMLHRDLSAKYRQSFLGYVWAVVPPIAMTLSFMLAGEAGIVNTANTSIPYPLFALLGTVLWQTFSEAIHGPMRAVTAAKPMLARIRFPYEAIILAKLGEVLFNLAIRLALVAVALAIYGVHPSLTMLFMPLAIGLLLLLGTAMGLLLVPLAGLYSDVEMCLSLLLSMWFFVTPVMYEQAAHGSTIGAINAVNPLTPVLVVARESLAGLPLSLGPGFAACAALAAAALVLGWLTYRKSLAYMIERICA